MSFIVLTWFAGKKRLTLSPQIVLLAHVRRVWNILMVVFQVSESAIFLKKLDFMSRLPKPRLGI